MRLMLTYSWTIIELYLAIIVASAPALKPFFRHFLVEPITSRQRASKSYVTDTSTSSPSTLRPLWSNRSSTIKGDDIEKGGMAIWPEAARQIWNKRSSFARGDDVKQSATAVHVDEGNTCDMVSNGQKEPASATHAESQTGIAS